MHIHELSRGAKAALVGLLSLAIILPLVALLPRYMEWQQQRASQRAVEQRFRANVSDSL